MRQFFVQFTASTRARNPSDAENCAIKLAKNQFFPILMRILAKNCKFVVGASKIAKIEFRSHHPLNVTTLNEKVNEVDVVCSSMP